LIRYIPYSNTLHRKRKGIRLGTLAAFQGQELQAADMRHATITTDKR